MKSLIQSGAFLLIGLYAHGQQYMDTIVTIKANSRMEILLPPDQLWVEGKDSCINFEYPTAHIIVLTSACNEIRKVKLKKTGVAGLKLEDNSLLDVPRPKTN